VISIDEGGRDISLSLSLSLFFSISLFETKLRNIKGERKKGLGVVWVEIGKEM
jgi:hypothetical protein